MDINTHRIMSYMSQRMRESFGSDLDPRATFGSNLDPRAIAAVQHVVNGQLSTFQNNNLIRNYRLGDVKVTADGQIQVDVMFTPTASFNTVNVSFSVGGSEASMEEQIEEQLVRYLENKPW